jgi:hypothetical protein
MSIWYQNHRAEMMVRSSERARAGRAMLNMLKQVPCMDCGGSFPPECMDFDHRPGTIKVGDLSRMIRHSVVNILIEVEKCDIVCANCHRLRTARRLEEYIDG